MNSFPTVPANKVCGACPFRPANVALYAYALKRLDDPPILFPCHPIAWRRRKRGLPDLIQCRGHFLIRKRLQQSGNRDDVVAWCENIDAMEAAA
jgi:hypothetical protein